MQNDQIGNRESRLNAVKALMSPDESRDEVLETFVHLAGDLLGISGSFISIIDDNNQYIKAARNFALKQSTRQDSLCRHVIDGEGELVITDTLLDSRFSAHPFVQGEPHIRFYAGVALANHEGSVVGTLCVTDVQPHDFNPLKLSILKSLANLVTSFLDAWSHAGFADMITHLPNRQRLIRDIQQLTLTNPGQSFRLIVIDCIDIPRAYELARTVGTAPVEKLLRQMAALISHRLDLNADEKLYAFAPGRFAVVQEVKGRFTAASVVDVLKEMNADLGENISIDLEVFTGETVFIPGDMPINEILRQAASALHEAIGENVSAMSFHESYDTRRTEDFLMMNDLATALKKDEGLYLAYQPKVCLKSGRTVGLEALIRWNHPDRGELFPSAFIPLAKKPTFYPISLNGLLRGSLHS